MEVGSTELSSSRRITMATPQENAEQIHVHRYLTHELQPQTFQTNILKFVILWKVILIARPIIYEPGARNWEHGTNFQIMLLKGMLPAMKAYGVMKVQLRCINLGIRRR
jgi:hypothetical protein